jgi:hypothetical protein
LRGVWFGNERGTGAIAFYERILNDGTRLGAKVRNKGGRPFCYEIVGKFDEGARDFGRELAISELEQVINENDLHRYPDARTGEMRSMFEFTDIPTDVPVRGSRGRQSVWDDRHLAEFVRDLENGVAPNYQRNTIRQLATKACERGLAEVADNGPPKAWRLTAHGQELLAD